MLLIGNGRVVTGNQEQPLIEDGSVVLDGNTVLEVGNYRDLKEKYADATFVDAKGGLIMPAFINTHEHIYSAMARGMSINGYNPHGFLEILDGFLLLKRLRERQVLEAVFAMRYLIVMAKTR